jgi:tetratricopeptide (TPR) repeat protein
MGLRQSAAFAAGDRRAADEALAALLDTDPSPEGVTTMTQRLSFAIYAMCVALEGGPVRRALAKIDGLVGSDATDPVRRGFQHLAHVYVDAWAEGDMWGALGHAEAAQAAFAAANDVRDATFAQIFVGMAHLFLGDHEEAERALAVSGTDALLVGLTCRAYVLRLLIERGAYDEARARFERALAARDSGLSPAYARWSLGDIARRCGDLERADREMAGGLDDLQRTYPIAWPEAMATLAAVQLGLGRTGEALAGARRAVEVLDAGGCSGHRPGFVRLVHAEALLAAGEIDAALGVLAAARDRLLALAARITDPAARRRFLEAVPEHARTLELARCRLAGAPEG